MIVDLKNKQWFLLSLFPLLFWSVLLPDFNYYYLIMALLGAVLTGFRFAIYDWTEGMDPLRKSNFVAYDSRFKKTMSNPFILILDLLLIPYGLISLIYFNVYVFNHWSCLPYYVWMLYLLTWATIFYGLFKLLLVPEYWEVMKKGFAYGRYCDDKMYWLGYGWSQIELKNYEEALRAFDKALEIDPKYAPSFAFRGLALKGMGKAEEAIHSFDKGLTLDPKNAGLWYERGNTLKNLKKYDDAVQNFDKALEINPKYVDAWGNRGLVLEWLGKYDDAIKSFDKGLAIDSNDTKIWVLRGRTLIKLKRYDEAIQTFDKALEIDPKYVDAWGNRGATFDLLKKYSDAIKCYDKALELDPKNAKTWYNKGLTLIKLSKVTEAVQSFDKALEIDPNDELIKNTREDLLKDIKNGSFKKMQ